MKTYFAKKEDIKRKWHLINAEGQILGRLAVEVAKILLGKDKPLYTPHLDCGDYCIVVNADKIKTSGSKLRDKLYSKYSGYPDGLKKISLEDMLKKNPAQVIRHAVKGMLPKGPLGRDLIKKLKVCTGSEHPYKAQKPKELKLEI